MLDLFETEDASEWRRRIVDYYATGYFTRAQRDALQALVTCLSSGTDPTDKNVADLARTCKKTVQRARVRAAAIGWLISEPTRKIDHDGQWRQGANAYELALPELPAVAPARPGGQGDRPRKAKIEEKTPTRTAAQQIAALGGIPAGIASLAAIATRRLSAIGMRPTRDKIHYRG